MITVTNLHKSFPMGEQILTVLKGINLSIQRGELIAVVGASGAGKSTLLHILGLLDRPTKGTVLYEGTDLFQLSETDQADFRNRRIGFVFQFYNLIPSLTALENVQLITEIAANPMRAEDAIEMVGLQERMNHFPAQLSGGEQQRVGRGQRAGVPHVWLCAPECHHRPHPAQG